MHRCWRAMQLPMQSRLSRAAQKMQSRLRAEASWARPLLLPLCLMSQSRERLRLLVARRRLSGMQLVLGALQAPESQPLPGADVSLNL